MNAMAHLSLPAALSMAKDYSSAPDFNARRALRAFVVKKRPLRLRASVANIPVVKSHSNERSQP